MTGNEANRFVWLGKTWLQIIGFTEAQHLTEFSSLKESYLLVIITAQNFPSKVTGRVSMWSSVFFRLRLLRRNPSVVWKGSTRYDLSEFFPLCLFLISTAQIFSLVFVLLSKKKANNNGTKQLFLLKSPVVLHVSLYWALFWFQIACVSLPGILNKKKVRCPKRKVTPGWLHLFFSESNLLYFYSQPRIPAPESFTAPTGFYPLMFSSIHS